jgi:protein TonB
MKTFIVGVFILLPFIGYGQETVKRSKAHTTPLYYKEVYYVLKSDKKTLEGSYAKLTVNGETLVDGFYKNGQKDSIWTEYDRSGKIIEKGKYENGKKSGIWNCYLYNGTLDLSYDFTKDSLLYYRVDSKTANMMFTIVTDSGNKKVKLDRIPLYLDGTAMIYNIIGQNLRYPVKAMINHISGRVNVTFTIDHVGKVSNYRITSGFDEECEEEALRVTKLIQGLWLPALYENKPVSVEYTVPIRFATL